MRWNPAFIVSLCPRGNGRPISANDGDLIGRINLLRLAGGFLGPFTTFAATAGLWKEGGDPCTVDEVDGTEKARQEDKVKEDAVRWCVRESLR